MAVLAGRTKCIRMFIIVAIDALLPKPKIRLVGILLQVLGDRRIFDMIERMASFALLRCMFACEDKPCCFVIEILFFELCNTRIRPQMFFMTIHTCAGSILIMISMFVLDGLVDLCVTDKAFFSGDLFTLFVTLRAVIDSL